MAEAVPFMRRVLSSTNFSCQVMSVLPAFPGCQVRNVSAFDRDCRAPTFHPVAVRPQAVCKPQSRLLCGCDVPRGGTLLCFGVFQPWYTIGHTPPGSSSGRVRPVPIQGFMLIRRNLLPPARGPFRQISRGQSQACAPELQSQIQGYSRQNVAGSSAHDQRANSTLIRFG